MRMITGFCLAAFAAGTAMAATVKADEAALTAPVFHVGDTWIFQNTVEAGPNGFHQDREIMALRELSSDTMTVGIKPEGAPRAFEDHVVGTDWSQRRLVDGAETVTTRPLAFPMKPGDTWSIDFIDKTRRGAQLSDHVKRTFRVVGWQDVTVPAGTFHALVIEARGIDEGTRLVAAQATASSTAVPGTAISMSHAQPGGIRTLHIVTRDRMFYVPAMRNWVKDVEEQYNTDEVLVVRRTMELAQFTPGA